MKGNNISRRNFLKHAAVGAAGMTTFGVMSSCSNNNNVEVHELFIPGTYTSAQESGFASIVVTCVFSSTAITDVSYEVVKSSNADYFKNLSDAAADYCKRIVKANSTIHVDGISGASLSTNAIKEGVNHCTAQAFGIERIKTELKDKSTTETKAANILPEELECSSLETETITEFYEEAKYDLVVIGAGASGVSAALAAAESGATVCILQKQGTLVSQGTIAAYLDLETSGEMGPVQWTYEQMAAYGFNNDFNLMKTYAYKSQEALGWFKEHLDSVGYTAYNLIEQADHVYEDSACKINGLLFPQSFSTALSALEPTVINKGIKCYYGTPAVQLIREGDKITGAIGKSSNGYVRVSAKKGVILAAGDYSMNDAMVLHYLPDAHDYKRKTAARTGDGHLLGMSIGAQIEPLPHCKMIHSVGASVMRDEPLLMVNIKGDRFLYYNVEFGTRNTILRYQPEHEMVSIFDANYIEHVTSWGGDPTSSVAGASPEQLAKHVKNCVVFKADTLEDLAAQTGIPAENLIASVNRHNDLCEMGSDVDFGTPSKYMKPVDTAPYYAQIRQFGIAVLPSGLVTDGNCQCLDANRVQIPGLFAAGNCAGGFFGGIDYSMNTAGLSLGRAINFGYLTGKYVAKL